MVRPSREILGSHNFKTNVLYVNVGFTVVEQFSCVVIEEEKRKTQVFQEMKEDFYNLVKMEKEQLLHTVVEDFVNIGQLWKAEAKGEKLWDVATEDFVDAH
jgi:hypothetical protein